jgi:hypothetical protein
MGERGHFHIDMPDRITFEQVEQALEVLGFSRTEIQGLTIEGSNLGRVTVVAGGLDYRIERTWHVDGYAVRMGPRREGAS